MATRPGFLKSFALLETSVRLQLSGGNSGGNQLRNGSISLAPHIFDERLARQYRKAGLKTDDYIEDTASLEDDTEETDVSSRCVCVCVCYVSSCYLSPGV